jgi:hypothetical protein
MTYPVALLPDLLVGWQKVADRYNIPIYVFQTGDAYQAVSNEAQGVGCLVNTLAPQVLVPEQSPDPKVPPSLTARGSGFFARGGNDE